MIGFLALHIIALLLWAAGILYIPTVIAGAAKNSNEFSDLPENYDSMARFAFTHIATPAALIAIVAGSIVFLLNYTVEFWLLLKLTLITMLATCHASAGLLIIRAERRQFTHLRLMCLLLLSALSVLMLLIVWLVLAKPETPEVLPWAL